MPENRLTQQRRHSRAAARAGLTLAELLVASTIMIMIATAMSMLAMTVHSANDHCQGQAIAAQHGRVILERISRAVSGATASADFPGAIVVDEIVGANNYPQTLVVWHPEGAAVDADGLPRVDELLLFTTDPNAPNVLLEIRDPGNSAVAPMPASLSAWRTLVGQLRSSGTVERVVLSDAVRTGMVTTASSLNPATGLRGAVRFTRLMAPTADEWGNYVEGDLDWDELNWPLDAYGTGTGARRVAIQTELQLASSRGVEAADVPAVPFYGSATLVYYLKHP